MNSNNHILNLADQCVKCGMCLPHCPTYNATHLESESPRGRIAIIQGLLTNKIANNQSALNHINNCLTCRACEKICPSDVQYGALLDQFKSSHKTSLQPIRIRLQKSFIRFILLNNIVNNWLLPWAFACLRLLKLNPIIGLSNSATNLSQQLYSNNKYHYPTQNKTKYKNKNSVGLFIGCTGASFDRQTVNDVIVVLNAIGFEVFLLPISHCCGALDSHAGNDFAAMQLTEKNIQLFKELNVNHIVYFATGCGALLTEYNQVNWTTTEQKDDAQVFNNKLSEITTFINKNWPEDLVIKSQKQSIAIHEPCTHRNVLKESDISAKLLTRISGITLLTLKTNKLCCGAAGDYMITHRTMANALRHPKLNEIKQLTPDIIVTTNVGCALHLRKGLYSNKQTIPVIHPISYLASLMAK